MKKSPGMFALLLVLPLIAMLAFASRPALADTREAYAKRAALHNAHREMFAIGDFAALDKSMNKIQQEYEKGTWTNYELWKLYNIPLSANDPAFEKLYDVWISAYPQSYAARQARGNYLFNRAVEVIAIARKSATIDKIGQLPPAEAASVKELMGRAVKDDTIAIGLATKPFLAYLNLIDMYGFTGDLDSSRKMYEAANSIAPRNVMARSRYIGKLERAGADIGQLTKLVDDARTTGLDEDDISLFTDFYGMLLDRDRFEQLDREMNSVQQNYESGKIDDTTLELYFGTLSNGGPTDAPRLNAWVKAYPKSYAARQVRALYSYNNAVLARGDKLAKDMSEEESAGLALYTRQARADGEAAASLTAKPLLAYRVMLNVAQLVGSHETAETMLRLANTIDSKNSVVRHAYMATLQSRWGGSLQKMENFLTQSKAAGVDDFALTTFERMIVEEKFWLGVSADEKYPGPGELVTGF